jgi:hypothetical protein
MPSTGSGGAAARRAMLGQTGALLWRDDVEVARADAHTELVTLFLRRERGPESECSTPFAGHVVRQCAEIHGETSARAIRVVGCAMWV